MAPKEDATVRVMVTVTVASAKEIWWYRWHGGG